MDEREEKALSAGGTVPGETTTGTAVSGIGTAVPPDSALMGSGAIGDTSSMGDDASVEDAAHDVNTLTGGTYAMPQANGDGSTDTNGDAPTSGLSSGGTIGGVPTGATESGMGGSGLSQ